jgi:hypothetical protein
VSLIPIVPKKRFYVNKVGPSCITADVATALNSKNLSHYFVEQKKKNTKLWVALKVFLPASGTVFSKRYY